ncbi:nitroreductase family protein [Ktedonospora formicarum]|uniref:Putative oxidoreductase n=1 Tax=Ktedonospora formicarum TaxID=2778364 RepID=A0A8J3MNJ1_9CHLR|nr:nitroreductase family protein [Ktedonospora formicarum]GHO42807.1 putative oxidoreductase [Ktedonospora formicarum]
MPQLDLSLDQLLTTTRSVRKRLDLSRPVELEVIRECLEIAIQAPTGSNLQQWHFVVVTDPEKRQKLADLYRTSYNAYRQNKGAANKLFANNPAREHTQERVGNSADYLAEHMHEVPVFLIPCFRGRFEGKPVELQASAWGSILPATWSFMLAARARGLGAAWTTLHLVYEEEAAQVLGIPYEKYTQAALVPVAYTLGTDFKPAPREPLDTILHLEQW